MYIFNRTVPMKVDKISPDQVLLTRKMHECRTFNGNRFNRNLHLHGAHVHEIFLLVTKIHFTMPVRAYSYDHTHKTFQDLTIKRIRVTHPDGSICHGLGMQWRSKSRMRMRGKWGDYSILVDKSCLTHDAQTKWAIKSSSSRRIITVISLLSSNRHI